MGRPAGANRNTRERILEAAGALFSEKGYAAASVKDIAGAVGIKDASLYNYFSGKDRLFAEAVDRERAHLASVMEELGVRWSEPSRRYVAPPMATFEELEDFALAAWRPLFDDGRVVGLRRMLQRADDADEASAARLRSIFYDYPLSFAAEAVERLCAAGELRQCNPRVAAYELCGPAAAMLGQGLPWSEASRRLRSQYRSFRRAYLP